MDSERAVQGSGSTAVGPSSARPRRLRLLTVAVIVGCMGAGLVGTSTAEAVVLPPVLTGVVQVSVGHAHTCALMTDRQVRCWGGNEYNQLGNATFDDSSLAVEVKQVTGATQVASGGMQSCAIVARGQVRCWGDGRFGALGHGTAGRPGAELVRGLTGATTLAAGPSHMCAIVAEGRVKCWGNNDSGQLGDGTTSMRDTPVDVVGITGATRIAAGGTQVIQERYGVFRGMGITCAVLVGGTAKCWGYNWYGQTGNGERGTNVLTPATVVGLSGVRDIAAQRTRVLGNEMNDAPGRTCALTTNGAVRCWGGYGAPDPAVVATYPGAKTMSGACVLVDRHIGCPGAPPDMSLEVTQFSEGDLHTCGVLPDTRLRCWGRNFDGQIGNGTGPIVPWPKPVVGLTGATSLTAGAAFTCATVSGGRVWCWGESSSGQTGTARTDRQHTPLRVPHLTGATHIASGDEHACVRLGDGTMRCWGAGGFGQLGDGIIRSRRAEAVVPRSIAGVRQITAGHGHTCALLAADEVRCWGWNAYGQLGDGTVIDRALPVTVAPLGGVTQVTAGFAHTCALVTGGRVMCWGANAGGRLGDGTTTDRWAPVAVPGITDAVQIAAGEAHTCARLADGRVSCWGANDVGQLGDGSDVDRSAPGIVTGVSGATHLALGGGSACAVIAEGRVRCWGLEPGTQPSPGGGRRESVRVHALAGAVELAAGGGHVCARRNDGQVLCWGGNVSGQLGIGDTTQWHPVLVRHDPDADAS